MDASLKDMNLSVCLKLPYLPNFVLSLYTLTLQVCQPLEEAVPYLGLPPCRNQSLPLFKLFPVIVCVLYRFEK